MSGIVSMGNMLGGMLLQPLIGRMLDRFWDGACGYGFEAYRAGFALMLVWLVVAIALAAFWRETHCGQSG